MLGEINVTPLVDVVLVLLLVFMVTAPMMSRGIDVSLPVANQPQTDEEDRVTVTRQRAASASTSADQLVTPAMLEDKLRAMMEGRTSKVVYLRADESLRYGRVIAVVDTIKKAGVEQIGFVYVLPAEKARVIDAVDRVLEQRAALDRGFAPTPRALDLRPRRCSSAWRCSSPGWARARRGSARSRASRSPLPRGGGGPSAPEPPRPRPRPSPAGHRARRRPSPKPEPPPKVLKPPKEEPRKGLPALDEQKDAPTPPRASELPRPRAASTARQWHRRRAALPGSTSRPRPASAFPAAPTPNGDWYLAGVQRKIWMIWTRQIKSGFTQPIAVSLTITETGALETDVRVVESGGVAAARHRRPARRLLGRALHALSPGAMERTDSRSTPSSSPGT